MKHTGFIALVVAGGVALTAGAAIARDHRAGPPAFETMDANGDGRITRAELEAFAGARLEQADTNGDGTLSLAELEAHGAERAKDRAARMMERLDADSDGQLSQEELRSGKRADRMFERADADGDGAITRAEFDDIRDKMRKRAGRDRG